MFSSIHKRVFSGILIIIPLLGILFWAPAPVAMLVILAFATVGLLEFYRLLDLSGIPCFRLLGVAAGLLTLTGTWLSCVHPAPPPGRLAQASALGGADWELFILFATVIAILLRQFPQKRNTQPFATIACTLLGVLYVPFLLNFFVKLAYGWERGPIPPLAPLGATGQCLILYVIAVTKTTDIGAYMVGSLLGRHKLAPRISPGKSWEGFFGGIAAGLGFSLACYYAWGGLFGNVTLRLADAIVLGILLPLLGTVGDLAESLLKRAAGAKDSGLFIPGMGGLLDVLDSLLFTAPALYIYARIFLSG